jgi:serine/threonine protein kinase
MEPADASIRGIDLPLFIPSNDINVLGETITKEEGKEYIKIDLGGSILSLEVFNPEQVKQDVSHLYVLIQAKDVSGVERKCYFNFEAVHTALQIDRLLFADASHGQLIHLFTACKHIGLESNAEKHKKIENAFRSIVHLYLTNQCRNALAAHRKDTGKCTKENFSKCYEWIENEKEGLEEELQAAIAEDPHITYIVVKGEDSGLPFNIEYRGLHDIRVKVIKNIVWGSANISSLYVDMYRGDHFLKSKRIIKDKNKEKKEDKNAIRAITLEAAVREAHIINSIRDIEYVVKYVRSPEIRWNSKKNYYNSYVYTEYLNGGTLHSQLQKSTTNPIDTKSRYRVMGDLCKALHTIHIKGISHRDIKLENCMLHNGRVRIIDFDLARFNHLPQLLSPGSSRYYDPHLVFLRINNIAFDMLNGSSDIYSSGVVGFALFAYVLPSLSSELAKNITKSILNGKIYNEVGLNQKLEEDFSFVEKTIKLNPELIDVLKSMLQALPSKRISLLQAAERFYKLEAAEPANIHLVA